MQIRSRMARRLAVGAAVVAALSMGPLALTGQAGATTTTATTGPIDPPRQVRCAGRL